MKQVKITVSENGSVEVEAFGFHGNECTKATEFLNEIFGNYCSNSSKAFLVTTADKEKNMSQSHATRYNENITDIETFLETAEGLGYEVDRNVKSVKLFGNNNIPAVASLKLPMWRYNVAINNSGELIYDAFGTPTEYIKKLRHLVRDYHKDLIINKIPLDLVSHFVCNQVGQKVEIILTYGQIPLFLLQYFHIF